MAKKTVSKKVSVPKTAKAAKESAPIVPETPIVPVVPVIPASVAKETMNQKHARIIAQNTVPDDQGRAMFLIEDKVYAETSMSPEEAEKFLGGKDPNLYFRQGYCHTMLYKILGDLVPEDREEYETFRAVIKNPDFLLFKHRLHNQYMILVPKVYTEHELTLDGDYVNKHVKQDYRTVAFTGQMGTPGSFEPFHFRKKVEQIRDQIRKVVNPKGMNLI